MSFKMFERNLENVLKNKSDGLNYHLSSEGEMISQK